MKSLFDTKISYYRNVEDNVGTEISLRDFLFNDQHKEQIEYIRSIQDEDKQKRLKLQLPVATISGTFAPTCKAENLVAHSNLLCIDIDKKDNMDVDWFDDLKHEWHNIPQILYAGRSIRGKGWFAIFRIAYPDKHEDQFEALKRDFANSGLIIDKACKNVNRMRFISYDPEPYINEDATLYTKVWVEPKQTYHSSSAYSGDNMEQVEKCCHIIETVASTLPPPTMNGSMWVQPWHHLVNVDVVCSIWSVRKMRSTKHLRQTRSSTIFCAISAYQYRYVLPYLFAVWDQLEGGQGMKVEITSFNSSFFEFLCGFI